DAAGDRELQAIGSLAAVLEGDGADVLELEDRGPLGALRRTQHHRAVPEQRLEAEAPGAPVERGVGRRLLHLRGDLEHEAVLLLGLRLAEHRGEAALDLPRDAALLHRAAL